MKQSNQNYISFSVEGDILNHKEEYIVEKAVESADVAYRLTRMAEEASSSSSVAPNAVGAADMSEYTAVSSTASSVQPKPLVKGVESALAGIDSRPVALLMARAKTTKRLLPSVAEAGFSTCVVYTADKRFDPYLKSAQQSVCLGEKYSDALYCNSFAVLQAAKECGAAVVLLCDEALPLAQVDSFLARAAAQNVRVFRPLASDAPLLGWVLCTTEKSPLKDSAWRTCRHCGLNFDEASLAVGHYICPSCGGYLRMSSTERINDLLDVESFIEWDQGVPETDPLSFPGYEKKLGEQRDKTGLEEGVRTGAGHLAGLRVAIGIMESQFLMGSMGAVVGEKVARLVRRATAEGLPVIVFTASGGARMQEGLVSLMQMAKVSCALERHAAAHLPYFSVLTDPTTGGVTASFAMQGDAILAEPRALIGFAGQRVIKDTIKQELPEGFQTAEFALEHGLIDAIVKRADLRETLAHLVAIHLSTARCSVQEPGDSALLIDYDSVCENLKHGTNTYNTVTYGDLGISGVPMSGATGWNPLQIRSRLSGIAERLDIRRGVGLPKRLQKMLSNGQFDTEEGVSLEGYFQAESTTAADLSNRAWQSVQLARNTRRPTSLAYIDALVDGFVELHGDRMFAEDGAIVGGVGWIGGRAVTLIAQEKGVDLKQRIARNFGCPQPEGYRKSLRLMQQAEKFGRPVVCLVDTQGAFCGTEAEERGQGNAIADNLLALAGLRVPVVSVLLGEGGSGGALALALADRVAMQEHAVYSVLSPEGFASILWKDRSRAPEAAAVMKMSAIEACEMGIVDAVLSEGEAPAHENPETATRYVCDYVRTTLDELCRRPVDELIEERHQRFSKF